MRPGRYNWTVFYRILFLMSGFSSMVARIVLSVLITVVIRLHLFRKGATIPLPPSDKLMRISSKWRLIGGFSDSEGEDYESAVLRELKEERGPIEVNGLKYEKSFNPDYALELRNEGLNIHKSGSFIGFGIAPLW